MLECELQTAASSVLIRCVTCKCNGGDEMFLASQKIARFVWKDESGQSSGFDNVAVNRGGHFKHCIKKVIHSVMGWEMDGKKKKKSVVWQLHKQSVEKQEKNLYLLRVGDGCTQTHFHLSIWPWPLAPLLSLSQTHSGLHNTAGRFSGVQASNEVWEWDNESATNLSGAPDRECGSEAAC